MPRRRSSENVRGEVVQKILEAIRTTDKIARDGKDPQLQVRWYQVEGYLSQTLDGLLRNVDQSEADKQLAELKEIVLQLQKRTARDPGTSSPAQS
jgi:transposase-like protein